ncbi:hypothetical protein A2755_02065 [Candidatus Wolfebacteria bacterium RIFCSPHIGHO2_01_FULL_48_22]|uniref:Uncharacterized protein n=2 Tax=Candidatus Wolfeibacteriota TaxID=1752735 RepID=A0A1F8DRU7_9BACT|nr:MAG: hypothetical protein A2755_02065 [Candidatus Wolfebacteria bacterium RIFCSPHIGHO2_01_FULL_48_22]OGM92329.1 MAG: hypothetical protein A2935_01005 [Candidatus Wolfebacteria bacterium RIFCSPLOWO2_01_FULL_47_17b]
MNIKPLNSVRVKKLYSGALIPKRASDGAVGYDVFAYHIIDKETKEEINDALPYILHPDESVLVGTGVAFAISPSYECQV